MRRQWLHLAITHLILVGEAFCGVGYMDSPVLSFGQGPALSARDASVITKFSFCKVIATIVISVSKRELQKYTGKQAEERFVYHILLLPD